MSDAVPWLLRAAPAATRANIGIRSSLGNACSAHCSRLRSPQSLARWMLSDMLGVGAFHRAHKTVGGIAAIKTKTVQLDADPGLAINAARITNRIQMAVNAAFVW